jgi:hypothetical protein
MWGRLFVSTVHTRSFDTKTKLAIRLTSSLTKMMCKCCQRAAHVGGEAVRRTTYHCHARGGLSPAFIVPVAQLAMRPVEPNADIVLAGINERQWQHGMSSSGTLGPLIPDQPRRLTREIFRPVPALKRALRRQDRSDPISRGIHLLGIAWPGANTPAFYFGLEQHAC